MSDKPTTCSSALLKAARKAARATSKAAEAKAEWVRLFEKEYGHTDISDQLVELIDYSNGNEQHITASIIAQNSKPGMS